MKTDKSNKIYYWIFGLFGYSIIIKLNSFSITGLILLINIGILGIVYFGLFIITIGLLIHYKFKDYSFLVLVLSILLYIFILRDSIHNARPYVYYFIHDRILNLINNEILEYDATHHNEITAIDGLFNWNDSYSLSHLKKYDSLKYEEFKTRLDILNLSSLHISKFGCSYSIFTGDDASTVHKLIYTLDRDDTLYSDYIKLDDNWYYYEYKYSD